MTFREAAIAVTYKCNSRCMMCSIWRNDDPVEIDASHYRKIPSTLKVINVTGGEPFLRTDLEDVISAIHHRVPGCRIVFSSNGMLTDRIVAMMVRIRSIHPNVGVGVSVDGLEETHDRIRGVSGIFKKATATVTALKSKGFSDLRVAMTVTNENKSEIVKVFELSRDLGVEFTITMAHDSDIYFGELDETLRVNPSSLQSEIKELIGRQLKSEHPKDWLRAYHTNGMIDAEVRRYFESRCEAGKRYFFMDPHGEVYPCNALDCSVGNICSVESLDALFMPSVKQNVRKRVEDCRKGCWMICNTRSLVLAHPLRVASWVAASKYKARFQRS